VRRNPLVEQSGVIARGQARASGLSEVDVRRLLRRREWVVVHPGVYVNHTGELTWLQRAWAAVLFAWPAALSHDSALRAADGPGKHTEEVIHVAVGRDRRIAAPPRVCIHRMTHLHDRTQWNLGPPRVRYEDAALDVGLASATDLAALGVVASAVQSRRTTAARMLARLDARLRTPRRAWLEGVLEDVATGACSVLEHGFLNRVERAHGLPRAERQPRATATLGVVYRDVEYEMLIVELDGRLFHDSAAQRDRDMDRDLDAAADGRTTIRLGYGQVFDRPCATALRLAALLRQRGWCGSATPCGVDCPAGPPRRSLAVTQ
jgi:hypothetical protein